MGTETPASASRAAISGTAAAASSLLTVIRTICEPARASASIWAAVAAGSAVSVFVIDWTTIGYADPTGTEPTRAVTVGLRGANDTRKRVRVYVEIYRTPHAVRGREA